MRDYKARENFEEYRDRLLRLSRGFRSGKLTAQDVFDEMDSTDRMRPIRGLSQGFRDVSNTELDRANRIYRRVHCFAAQCYM